MKLKDTITGLSLIAGLSACAGNAPHNLPQIPDSDSEPEVMRTLYRGASLIDGTGQPLQQNSSILVTDDKIEAVYTGNTSLPSSLPENTKVIDASNWYVLPGLIDSHVHLATSPARKRAEGTSRRYLYSGITSVRDMAGDARALADLARASLTHEIPAPDIYYSALVAGPSFFSDPRTQASGQGVTPGDVPWMRSITDESNISEAVTLARGTGATGIKIYANLAADLVQNVTAEGVAQGIQVWSHSMVFPALPSEVASAKVDVMSHVCRIVFESTEKRPTQYHHKYKPDYDSLDPYHPLVKQIFDNMARDGIILDATLRLYGELEEMRTNNPDAEIPIPVSCPLSFAVRLTQHAIQAGVDISAGTDGATAYQDAYPALHEEIEILVNQAGMSPLQAIRSATYVGAMTLGKETEMGTIQAGKMANLVFLERNPLEDIANLRSVVLTVKRGIEYPRADFTGLKADEHLE